MKRYILAILTFLIAHSTFAQFATTYIDELELKFKVKQIDEFMQRFNYDITYDGKRCLSLACCFFMTTKLRSICDSAKHFNLY